MSEKNGVRAQAAVFAGKVKALTPEQREELSARMGTVVNPAGHRLTFNNTAMLCLQSGRYDLTMVAGYKQWISAGRIVSKGQKAIGCIMVPMSIKDKYNPDADPKIRFRYVPVFDVTQTEELVPEEVAS